MALTDAEAEELVAHVAAMVKAGVPHTSTLHNWSITYTTREKKGANGAPRVKALEFTSDRFADDRNEARAANPEPFLE